MNGPTPGPHDAHTPSPWSTIPGLETTKNIKPPYVAVHGNVKSFVSAGNASSGSIAIGGTIGLTLLTGDLTDFGFGFLFNDPGQDLFEFMWNVTGGTLASDFGG